jgi:polyhydroxyalkanoate synthesis regulator phasin
MSSSDPPEEDRDEYDELKKRVEELGLQIEDVGEQINAVIEDLESKPRSEAAFESALAYVDRLCVRIQDLRDELAAL